MNTQAKEGQRKQEKPELFCKVQGCLWRITKRVPGTDYWIPSPCKRHPVNPNSCPESSLTAWGMHLLEQERKP